MPKAATDTPLALSAFSVGGLPVSGGKLPDKLVVCPWGARDIGHRGQVVVNELTVSAFAAGQKALGRDGLVAGDFDHNTVEGTETFKADKEPRLVASWGKAVVEPGIGIIVTDLTYTPEGKAALEGGHFQDISPAVVRNKEGVVIGLHSFAFCRHGQIEGFTIEAAAATGQLKAKLTALSASLSPQESDSTMKPTPALIALLAALGTTLAADADEATLTKALEDTTAKVNAAKEEEKPEIEGMSAKITELTGQITTLSADMKAVKDERDQIRREALMQQAAHEGKVIPLSAEVLKVTPLSVLEDLVKTAKPGEVPTQSQQHGSSKGEGEGKVEAFSAESLARFEAMGLTQEDVAKYAPQCVPAAKTP